MAEKHRMFYNDDGDSSMSQYRGPIRPQMITDAVDVLLGAPITTICYCADPGGCTNYPTQVGSMAGWRKVKANDSGHYKRQYEFYQYVREHNWDIPRMVMERALERGFEFVPSMRMNDAHFGQKVPPAEDPWTTEFWVQHQDLVIGPAQFKSWGNQHLLDFRHKEVRDYGLALAFEMIDRYAADGFEMDWTRHYTFFKPGDEQPELLTDMVRQVRRKLDERGRKLGKKLFLITRVTPSIKTSLELGLDVAGWVREGLVDYVVPSSPTRYISMDMPVDEWVDLVKGKPVEIHPSPDSAAPRGNGQATLEMYRAAASNYYAMGAHGFYFFNLFCRGYPLDGTDYVIMRDASDPDALSRRDKFFMADVINWRSDTDTLGVKLDASKDTARIGLWVGDDLAGARAATSLRSASLRVRVSALEPQDRLEVALNGVPLDIKKARVHAPTGRDVIAFNASIPTWTYERAVLGSSPGIWFEFELGDPLPRRGDNIVTVRRIVRDKNGGKYETTIVNVDLAVCYDYCGRDDLLT